MKKKPMPVSVVLIYVISVYRIVTGILGVFILFGVHYGLKYAFSKGACRQPSDICVFISDVMVELHTNTIGELTYLQFLMIFVPIASVLVLAPYILNIINIHRPGKNMYMAALITHLVFAVITVVVGQIPIFAVPTIILMLLKKPSKYLQG